MIVALPRPLGHPIYWFKMPNKIRNEKPVIISGITSVVGNKKEKIVLEKNLVLAIAMPAKHPRITPKLADNKDISKLAVIALIKASSSQISLYHFIENPLHKVTNLEALNENIIITSIHAHVLVTTHVFHDI